MNSPVAAMPLPLLVVDGEPSSAEYLQTRLEALGFEVHSAFSAEAALRLARSHGHYAAAFVGLVLPDCSGLELMDDLHTLQPALSVVIASRYASMALRDLDEHRCPPKVLLKPFTPEAIEECAYELGLLPRPSRA